jgi:hypothetical protein
VIKEKVQLMDITNNKYDANFAIGALFYNEFIVLEKIFLSDNFNELIKVEEVNNELVGIATFSARKRILREIKRRYNTMNLSFWEFFYELSEKEQKLALFFVILKTYPIVMDIHVDIALSRFKIGSSLDVYDITMKLDEIASRNERVASWSETTFRKINIQYRKMIKDIGIYQGNNLVTPSGISNTFWDYFKKNNEAWFIEACFVNI